MKQPCSRDCEGRNATCHAVCEKWAKFEEYKKGLFERKAKKCNEALYFIDKTNKARRKYLTGRFVPKN